MKKTVRWSLVVVCLLAGGISTYVFAFAGGRAPVSSGQAQAQLDPDRPDCPGRIVCPLTGELVCRDRCPLAPGAAKEEESLPDCCRGKKK